MMDAMLRLAHAENYERESAQKTLTTKELHEALAEIIAQGKGHLPVFVMEVDGLTHAIPLKMCFEAEPGDGELVWIILDRSQ